MSRPKKLSAAASRLINRVIAEELSMVEAADRIGVSRAKVRAEIDQRIGIAARQRLAKRLRAKFAGWERGAVRSIPKRTRQAWSRWYADGMSVADIARKAQRPYSGVYAALVADGVHHRGPQPNLRGEKEPPYSRRRIGRIDVAALVRQLRAGTKPMTLSQIADLAGVTRQAVWSVANERREPMLDLDNEDTMGHRPHPQGD